MRIDKDNIKIILILLIVGLGIGYAYINTNLNINGTAQVNSASWNVHWANIQVKTGSVSASSPTITNQTTVNYSVILNQPGDYYEFTVDAINGGTIDAMIDTIDSKLNGATITTLPAYLKYNITYSSGTALEPNHELKANSTEKYRIRIEYKDDIELGQLPASNQTLSLQFTVTYRQANENAVEIVHKITGTRYAQVDNPGIVIGSSFSDESITLFDTQEEVWEEVSAVQMHHFFKYTFVNNIATEAYVGYRLNNKFYYIQGAGATYNSSTGSYNQDSPYYTNNKKVLASSFGANKCTDNGTNYFCNDPSQYNLYGYIDKTGNVYIRAGGGWFAGVSANGESGYYD